MSETGAELLVASLGAAGLTTIFGVPGDTGVAFYDALESNTAGVRHVLARDERHAAFMADAFARATGRIGVVEVSSGGGATFAVGGLGEARASGIPVLVLTSDIHRASRGTGALTEIHQPDLFKAVSKRVISVDAAADIPAAVAELAAVAVAGRPGPVVLIVPEDVYEQPVDLAAADLAAPAAAARTTPAERTPAPQDAVERAAAALAAAQRPVIFAGSGVHASGGWEALADLAERAAAPVATTIHGVGVLPDAHPWLLGTCGNNSGLSAVNAHLADADFALFVGTRANATDTNGWTTPPRAIPTATIEIEDARVDRNYPDTIGLPGDAATVLAQLAAAVAEAAPDVRAARARAAAQVRDAWRHEDSGTRPGSLPAGMIDAPDVVTAVAEALAGTPAMAVADPGTPTPAVTIYWPNERAGRDVLIPRGHGPMGYAIPAAVGASFARPGDPIVAFTADGSLAMACGELETAVRYALPILFVELDNRSLGWIKMLQHLYEGERYFGVDPGPIDGPALARACGMRGVHAATVEDLRAAVEAFAADRLPTYIAVRVPHMIDRVPQVPAWHAALAGDSERPVY